MALVERNILDGGESKLMEILKQERESFKSVTSKSLDTYLILLIFHQ